ncbi:PaaI family thioesterase [Roseovarius aestuarii]|nr:PaaI family thioesterase [Roseovarius aestuarii]
MTKRTIARTFAELPATDVLLHRSGLEFMRDTIAGVLAGPPIGATLGFWPIQAEEGRVEFEGTPDFDCCNALHAVHGGWYGALLDSCMASAILTCVPKGSTCTTLEYKINITRAAPVGVPVRATGLVTHAGRSTGVATGEVRGLDDGKLYASGSTTCMIMALPVPVPDQTT